MIARFSALAAILLAGCAPGSGNGVAATNGIVATDRAPAPVEAPAPGAPGGLADDRAPVSEAPFADSSAQGAANVVQTYFALIEAGRYAEARRLRRDDIDDAAFAASFARYRDYHGEVGAPGEVEGAAGSSYVEVPVAVYGRRSSGEAFRDTGTMTLRRVNDVDGSTAEQRRWHIERDDVEPRFRP